MPKYDKIEDLLKELNQNRKLFAALFDRRMMSVPEESVLELLDGGGERLERLAAYGLLVRTPGQVGLEPHLQGFFEEYMEVDETVHVLYIQEHLDEIRKLAGYYLKDHQNRYLLRIKKNLREIVRIASLNVKTLRFNMEETYKTESDFQLKRDKLEDIRSQRDALDGVIKAVEGMLSADIFFKTAVDEELLQIVHLLKMGLRDTRHNLIEIQQQIVSYLNHIERRAVVVEKVVQLKMLKDKHFLNQRTDFYSLSERTYDLPLAKTEPLRARLSLTALRDEPTMGELVLKVRRRLRHRTALAENLAEPLPESALVETTLEERSINLYALKNIFMKRGGDLFSFVMEHQFERPLGDAERIGVFCQLASRFESLLRFSDETAVYGDVEYARVFATDERRGELDLVVDVAKMDVLESES